MFGMGLKGHLGGIGLNVPKIPVLGGYYCCILGNTSNFFVWQCGKLRMVNRNLKPVSFQLPTPSLYQYPKDYVD